jgi:hypothetical protein
LKNSFIPDAFVFLRIETETAAKRKLYAAREVMIAKEKERLLKVDQLPKEICLEPENPLLVSLLKTDEKLIDDLSVKIEEENNSISEYQSFLETWGSLPIVQVYTGRCLRPVLAEVDRHLTPYLKNV